MKFKEHVPYVRGEDSNASISKTFAGIAKSIKKHLDILSTMSIEHKELCDIVETKLNFAKLTIDMFCEELKHLKINATVHMNITEEFFAELIFCVLEQDDDENAHFDDSISLIDRIFVFLDFHLGEGKLKRNQAILKDVIKEFKDVYLDLQKFRYREMKRSKGKFLQNYKDAQKGK